ncbi:hypothetical protein M404DRAFT_638149 [Pisolithus tinctorius Marx 270]|uniref:Uncharacterized protein n=1 Tax=Pisolithus tinctorius Marx 270 TaxID=870435 RepID=A0A0C3K017_PISTI|nr:hypothetical protein M404DRAFT_638149 [Pisolithus tinctorius Marx 270]
MIKDILIGATSKNGGGTQHGGALQIPPISVAKIFGNPARRCFSIMYLRPRGAGTAEFVLGSRSYGQYVQAVTGGKEKKNDEHLTRS